MHLESTDGIVKRDTSFNISVNGQSRGVAHGVAERDISEALSRASSEREPFVGARVPPGATRRSSQRAATRVLLGSERVPKEESQLEIGSQPFSSPVAARCIQSKSQPRTSTRSPWIARTLFQPPVVAPRRRDSRNTTNYRPLLTTLAQSQRTPARSKAHESPRARASCPTPGRDRTTSHLKQPAAAPP